MSKQTSQICPCGSGLAYPACCAPLHQHGRIAQSALELMRSRYCAYALGLEDYLLHTWHPQTRPWRLNLANDTPDLWLGLKILAHDEGAAHSDKAFVEFVAKYKVNGRAHRLHERSRFVRHEGRWYYLDGQPGS